MTPRIVSPRSKNVPPVTPAKITRKTQRAIATAWSDEEPLDSGTMGDRDEIFRDFLGAYEAQAADDRYD